MKYAILILSILASHWCYGEAIKVARIIDGDTFETETGEKVRLVGINAPEISDIFGDEAKHHLVSLIGGKIVELLGDPTSHNLDKYGRLLRYVVLEGNDVNKQMVLDGYAFAYLKYHFDPIKETLYRSAQIEAQGKRAGIWGGKTKIPNIIDNPSDIHKSEKPIPIEKFIVSSLLGSLIFIGLYYYFKK